MTHRLVIMTDKNEKKAGFVSWSGVCFIISLYILLFLFYSFNDINDKKKKGLGLNENESERIRKMKHFESSVIYRFHAA